VGLGSNESLAAEDAPDGGNRRDILGGEAQVVGDGVWTAVEAGGVEVLAELEDGVLDRRCDLVGTGARPFGTGF
jgi:hypothetical protein